MFYSIDKHASVFFGNAAECTVSCKEPHFKTFCNDLRKKLDLEYLVFQDQKHGINGWSISDTSSLSDTVMYKEREGDFLITNQRNVGIGVLTADCLPLVFYDPVSFVISIAHAGWCGSVANIGAVTVEHMKHDFDVKPENIVVFFGPAARNCCYEVQQDFIDHSQVQASITKIQSILEKRNGKYFFDNTQLTIFNLQQAGILPQNINTAYNICTICNHEYHSYRRLKPLGSYENQETIVWLT